VAVSDIVTSSDNGILAHQVNIGRQYLGIGPGRWLLRRMFQELDRKRRRVAAVHSSHVPRRQRDVAQLAARYQRLYHEHRGGTFWEEPVRGRGLLLLLLGFLLCPCAPIQPPLSTYDTTSVFLLFTLTSAPPLSHCRYYSLVDALYR
jgi:hypothetical protein